MDGSTRTTVPSLEDVSVPPNSDRPGRIETHGTDFIPTSERYGRPRSLFTVWAASNVTYLYIVLGGTMILLGLNIWQALAVIVLGNLFWIAVGYLSISGPLAGTPSEIITRSMFGVRGNRILNLTVGWIVGVSYEAINLSIAALAAFALFGADAQPAKIIIVLVLAAVTFTISVYGHATIVRLSGWFTWILLAALAVLAVFIVQNANFSYETPVKLAVHGWALWAVAAIGFTIIASTPLSWNTGADYARYLPASTSSRAIIWWTAIGGFLPAVALGTLGVLAGTVVNMADPQTSLATILPHWFYPVFLVVIIVGSVTNNVLTAYSTGLALLAAGIPWKRSVTVIFDAVIAVAMTCYALFVSNFFDSLNSILELTVAPLGALMAIYSIDTLLRKNRYDLIELQNDSRGGPLWFRGGFNLAGCMSLVAGTGVALLSVDTTVFVGPISNALGGADLSALVGPIIAGTLYFFLARAGIRNQQLPSMGTSE